MTTYLEELQSAYKEAYLAHELTYDWLVQGADVNHSTRELVSAELSALTRLRQAKAELDSYLLCATKGCSGTLTFRPDPIYGKVIQCYCPECLDIDSTMGQGPTEADALEDYHEMRELV